MIYNTIINRRTIRDFEDLKIDRATIEKIVEAGIHAPSASNHQNWRFLAIDNQDTLNQLVELVKENKKIITKSLEGQEKEIIDSYGDYFTRFNKAPVVIFLFRKVNRSLTRICQSKINEDILKDINDMEESSSLLNVGMVLQNMMLYAHDIGVGSSCLTGPLIAKKSLEQFLKTPSVWALSALLALGYSKETPKSPGRKKIDNSFFWYKETPQ
jgi:nitroreductase